MHCPECGSGNVDCSQTPTTHVHECHDCGYRTVAAQTRSPR